jgi:hypothetical protein
LRQQRPLPPLQTPEVSFDVDSNGHPTAFTRLVAAPSSSDSINQDLTGVDWYLKVPFYEKYLKRLLESRTRRIVEFASSKWSDNNLEGTKMDMSVHLSRFQVVNGLGLNGGNQMGGEKKSKLEHEFWSTTEFHVV